MFRILLAGCLLIPLWAQADAATPTNAASQAARLGLWCGAYDAAQHACTHVLRFTPEDEGYRLQLWALLPRGSYALKALLETKVTVEGEKICLQPRAFVESLSLYYTSNAEPRHVPNDQVVEPALVTKMLNGSSYRHATDGMPPTVCTAGPFREALRLFPADAGISLRRPDAE